jgi:hypothetical protein
MPLAEQLEPRELLTLVLKPISPIEGQLTGGKIATFAASDLLSPPGTATITWGDGQSTPNATIAIDAQNHNLFDVLGSHTYSQVSTFSLSVTVTDNKLVLSATESVTVAPAALTVNSTSFAAVAGQNTFVTVATFHTGEPNPTTSEYTATIDWGNGETTIGAIGSPNSGVFAVTGSAPYTSAGSFSPKVTITRIATQQVAIVTSTADVLAPVNTTGAQSVVFPLTAHLGLVSNGLAPAQGITSNNQPLYEGTAAPGATVLVFVRRPHQLTPVLAGETIAGPDGVWQMSLKPLADGAYIVTGVQIPPGSPPTLPVEFAQLVIDTKSPKRTPRFNFGKGHRPPKGPHSIRSVPDLTTSLRQFITSPARIHR